MRAIYADDPLSWDERLRIYTHYVGAYGPFFAIVGLSNCFADTSTSTAYALSQFPLAVAFTVFAIWHPPVIRGIALWLIFGIGLFAQAVSAVEHLHGFVAIGLAVSMMAKLGWFRLHRRAKCIALVVVLMIVTALSNWALFYLPSGSTRTIWSAIANTAVAITFLYQLWWLNGRPFLAERRARIRTQIAADIAAGLARETTVPRGVSAGTSLPPNTISRHLDAIDALAAADLSDDRAAEYRGHTEAVRNKLADFVRKYIIEPITRSTR